MTEPLPDTWYSRDLPVLRATVTALEKDFRRMGVGTDDLLAPTGLEPEQIALAIRALASDRLVEQGRGSLGDLTPRVIRVFGQARRLAGSWPTPGTALDRMIAALEEIATNTSDEDTRTRARKILDGVTASGGKIGLAMATAMATGVVPH